MSMRSLFGGHPSALVSHRITDFPTSLGMAVTNADLIIPRYCSFSGFIGIIWVVIVLGVFFIHFHWGLLGY